MPQFRDPIHGFIHVSRDEQKIIDSPPFQRLRNIRQLGTSYLVYHGAEHTRFGHSIGVMHLVTRAFSAVTENTKGLFRHDFKENTAYILWYRQILRLIALTHDLGHAPFSHASEELFPKGLSHENYTEKIIKETVIAEYIKEIGAKLHTDISESVGISSDDLIQNLKIRPITPELIWTIYGEKPRLADDEYIMPDFMFLKGFMDSELDCDKMDYLLRDSYYCGVKYGEYDLDRLISSLTVNKNEQENTLQLAIKSSGIQALEEFIIARYFMFIQVYFHRSRKAFDKLLIKGLTEILPDGKYPEGVGDYLAWDDVSVLHKMRYKDISSSSRQYIERKKMHCVYESSAHVATGDRQFIKTMSDKLLPNSFPGHTFFFDESDKMPHGLLPSGFLPGDNDSDAIKIINSNTDEAEDVLENSILLTGISGSNNKINICRIYAEGKSIDAIKTWVKNEIKESKS